MADTFNIDVSTGALTRTLDDGTEITTTLDELSGGRLTLEGNRIRDLDTGRFVTQLSSLRDNTVTNLGEGRLLLNRSISESELNSAVFAGASDAVGFDWELELPTGERVGASAPISMVTGVGSILAINEAATGAARFADIVPEIDPVTGEITNLPEQYRLASASEAMSRSLEGYLLSKQRDLMERMSVMGLEDETGRVMETAYDVAAFIARSIGVSFSTLSTREI